MTEIWKWDILILRESTCRMLVNVFLYRKAVVSNSLFPINYKSVSAHLCNCFLWHFEGSSLGRKIDSEGIIS